MSDKLNTQSVFGAGDVVHIQANATASVARVIYTDSLGICIGDSSWSNWYEYVKDAPAYSMYPTLPYEIRGSHFYPWSNVDSVRPLLESAHYETWVVGQTTGSDTQAHSYVPGAVRSTVSEVKNVENTRENAGSKSDRTEVGQ